MEDNQQQELQPRSDEKLVEHPTFVASNDDDKKEKPANIVDDYVLDENFSLIKADSNDHRQQPQQIKLDEKLVECPTLLDDSAMMDNKYELDSNFSILKLESEKPVISFLDDSVLNPDDYTIEKTDNCVDLDFSMKKILEDKNIVVGKENPKDKESTIEPTIGLIEEIGNKYGAGADDSLNTTDSFGDICDEKFDLLEASTCENISEEMDSSMDNGSKIVSDVGGDILDKTPINEEMKVINDNNIDSIVNQTPKAIVEEDSDKMTRVDEDIADKLSEQFSGLKTEEKITPFTDSEPMMNESNFNERKKRSIEDYGLVEEESTIPKFVDQQLDQQPLPAQPSLVDIEKISPDKTVSNDDDNQQWQSSTNSNPSSLMTESSQVHDSPAAASATAIAATLLNDDDKINNQPTIPMTNENATSTFSGGSAKPSFDDDQQTLKKREEVVVASANKNGEKSIEGAAGAIVTESDDDDFLPTSATKKEQTLSPFLATTTEAKQKKEKDDDVDVDHKRPTTNENIIIEEPPQQQQQQLQPEREEKFADIKDKEQVPEEKQQQQQQPSSSPEVVNTSLTSSDPLLSSSSIEGQQFDTQEIKTDQQPEPSAPTLIHLDQREQQQQQQQQQPSEIMGKKSRYNQSDNSGSSGSANLEPDCLYQFIQTLFGQCVADILYWRDPKNSGVVFGAGLVILFSLTIFSVISVVAYTLLFTLLGTLSFRVYKNVMQAVNKTEDGHPFKEYLEVEITPSRERAHEIADQLLSNFNCFITRMRSVLLVEDYVESFKYLFLFWALTFIGAWFNGMTLVILAYIGAFSVPKLYEMNQAQIDQYINLVTSKINEITEKIPFLKKATSSEKKDD